MTKHTHQAILHVVDSAEGLPRAVAAAEALRAGNPDLGVRVIVNGPALDGVTDSAEQLSAGAGTTIEACEFGMQRRSVRLESLQPGILTVPSAVGAIVEAQLAGAVYVRI